MTRIPDEKIRQISYLIQQNGRGNITYFPTICIENVDYCYLHYNEEDSCCDFFCTVNFIYSSIGSSQLINTILDVHGIIKLKKIEEWKVATSDISTNKCTNKYITRVRFEPFVPIDRLVGIIDGKYISIRYLNQLSEVINSLFSLGYGPELPHKFTDYINELNELYEIQ